MNGAPTPGTGGPSLCWKRAAGVCALDAGRRPRWVTHVVTLGSLQDVEEEEMPCDHRSRGWGDAVTSPGPWELDRSSPGASGGSTAPLPPCSGSDPRTVRINSGSFQRLPRGHLGRQPQAANTG